MTELDKVDVAGSMSSSTESESGLNKESTADATDEDQYEKEFDEYEEAYEDPPFNGCTEEPTSTLESLKQKTIVKNFREAHRLPHIYRCGSTDGLGDVVDAIAMAKANNQDISSVCKPKSAEDILLYRAGLVLDLRSLGEIDVTRAAWWTSAAPGGPLEIKDFVRPPEIEKGRKKKGQIHHHHHSNYQDSTNGEDDEGLQDTEELLALLASPAGESTEQAQPSPEQQKLQRHRTVLRIDVMSPPKLFDYISSKWLKPSQKAMSTIYSAVDANKRQDLRFEALNSRGLSGLYEAILETAGKHELCFALKAMTVHLETSTVKNTNKEVQQDGDHQEKICDVDQFSGIVVHCVQGKDRTGILIMLCQCIMGVSDEEIITDYHVSNKYRSLNGPTAAGSLTQVGNDHDKAEGKLDRRIFSGAPRHAMIETLAYIRHHYSSVCPGYLNAIDFGLEWRERFRYAIRRISTPGWLPSAPALSEVRGSL